MGVTLARYFGMEFVLDASHPMFFPGRASEEDAPPESLKCLAGHAMVNLAGPHGVMNYGAAIFCFFSRWLVGSDQCTAAADVVRFVPGLRHFTAPLWIVPASRREIAKRFDAKEMLGIVPDGISGIFAAGRAPSRGNELLAIGKKRGLVRLVLQKRAGCVASYFVGTLQLYTIWQDPFGILAEVSRKLRVSLFLFWGRFGESTASPRRAPAARPRALPSLPARVHRRRLPRIVGLPIPRRGPITCVVAYTPPLDEPILEPTPAQLDAHHAKIYGALQTAFDANKAHMGMANATLTIT